MANRKPVNVACPNCSKQSTFTMWQNVDSMQDPMLKQQILVGTIFDFKFLLTEFLFFSSEYSPLKQTLLQNI